MNQKQQDTARRLRYTPGYRHQTLVRYHSEKLNNGKYLVQYIFGGHWFDHRVLTAIIGKFGGINHITKS